MAIRKIRQQGDPLLKRKSHPVKRFDEKLGILLDDMLETMTSVNGLGLAAPQVGVLKRVVLIVFEGVKHELVNPEIVDRSGTQNRTEACLSVAGKYGFVERPQRVVVKAFNRQGEEIEVVGEDYFAVALCHETDHLNGVLYTDLAYEMHDNDEETSEEPEGEEAEKAAELAGSQAEAYAADKSFGVGAS
jgi:peptide deformylase